MSITPCRFSFQKKQTFLVGRSAALFIRLASLELYLECLLGAIGEIAVRKFIIGYTYYSNEIVFRDIDGDKFHKILSNQTSYLIMAARK